MKTRLFESEGIFISIVFARNIDREPAWKFVIETVDDPLYESCIYGDYRKCEIQALKKAIEYLP